jgi:hypothetical protein
MRRKLTLIAVAGALAVSGGGAAIGAPKACSPGAPGCDTEQSTQTTHQTGGQSGGFNSTTTETQRGQTTAPGTEPGTTTTTCTGPSGKTLRADHPQCS